VGEPLTRRRRVSLRIRNFESSKLKVNDQDGNPIEIAAVVVWKVVETAEAIFCVDDYEHFVHVQSESAVRSLATTYPYDAHVEGQMSLRMSVMDIAHRMREEIQESPVESRRGGHRGPHHAPGVRARNSQRHAAAAAGQRHHRGPAERSSRAR